ncbi:MAG: BolA family protein [Bdellovibrionota bacterium]
MMTADDINVIKKQRRSGGHYSVWIVSEMFAGKTLIERHQMIYQALVMPRPEIHALSIVARIEKEI